MLIIANWPVTSNYRLAAQARPSVGEHGGGGVQQTLVPGSSSNKKTPYEIIGRGRYRGLRPSMEGEAARRIQGNRSLRKTSPLHGIRRRSTMSKCTSQERAKKPMKEMHNITVTGSRRQEKRSD